MQRREQSNNAMFPLQEISKNLAEHTEAIWENGYFLLKVKDARKVSGLDAQGREKKGLLTLLLLLSRVST